MTTAPRAVVRFDPQFLRIANPFGDEPVASRGKVTRAMIIAMAFAACRRAGMSTFA